MNIRTTLASAAIMAASAFAIEAATYPTFDIDIGSSSINVTQGSGCVFLSCATLTGSFASGATGFAWTPTGVADSIYVNNFFKWSVEGIGIESFNVAVKLAFSSPDAASANGSGSGLFFTLYGIISGGILDWSSVESVSFAQGSKLDIGFDNVQAIGFGNSVYSGATFTGNLIVPVAPVPLPASVPLLGAGLLALGWFGRRKATA